MAEDITLSPYFDDYDPDKNFTKIVGVAGRVSQTREFTQAQDIQSDYLERLGNAVLKNGKVLSGCDLTIDQEMSEATLASGQVFIDGLVRNVPEATVEISGVGSETIGVKIEVSLVKETDDDSLYDNAEGYKNYGNSGAHRIKEQPSWVANDPSAVTIYTLVDGQRVVPVDQDDTMYKVNETLARRTFDENGSYKVTGLQILDRKQHDEENLYVSVTEGKAYVAGYETVKDTVSRVAIRRATDTRTQYNETNDFVADVTYPIANTPVENVIEVNCIVQKTVNMTRGNISGGLDRIVDSREGSVVEIVKVWAGDTTYQAGVDYSFDQDGINWALSGTEPQSGSQYQVTYKFNQVMNPEEYRVSHRDVHHSTVRYTILRGEKESDSLPIPNGVKVVKVNRVYKGETAYSVDTDWVLAGSVNSYRIDWSAQGSEPEAQESYDVEIVILVENPDNQAHEYLEFTSPEYPIVVGSKFVMDYSYYLARTDLVVMNPNAVCSVVEGQPDVLRRSYPPTNSNERVIPIGTVTAYPNSDTVDVVSYRNYRLDQGQLYNIRQRVDNLEYNVAMSDLDEEAMEGETPTQLRGVFTDGFIGPTKADVTHKEFDCSFDFDNGYLMLPQNEGIVGMQPNREGSARMNGGIASAPYEEIVYIEQPYATEDFLVNPYAVYDNLAIVELNPYVDNWVDSTRLTVDGGTTYDTDYREVNGGTRYVDGGTVRRREVRGTIFPDYTVTTHEQTRSTSYETTKSQNVTQRTQTDIILDEAILYMRPIDIEVTGSNFTLNADNLTAYFNDGKVNLRPEGGTQAGTDVGTVKSDSAGKFRAKFTVPEGTPCGNVEVRVENDYNHGGTRFSAQGRKQIIQDTVFTTVTNVTTRTKYDTVTDYTVITTIHDPLAQSFYVDDDIVLTDIGLFFSEKDDTKNVIIEVRDLDNGYPSANILMQQVVDSSDVTTSDDASQETKVVLKQPLYLKGGQSYCFVIVSDSNKYRMWTAKLGGVDDKTQPELYQVVQNPYIEGVMFSSSNAQTWTDHQESDLKFKLYRAKYTGPGVIIYPEAQMDNATAMVLAAQTADYDNQGVHWYYRPISNDDSDNETWLPIETFSYWNLSRQVTRVALKCELETKSDNMSPFLNVESVNLVYYNNSNTGAYVSRQVVMEQEFDTLQVSVEAYTTPNTSFKVLYSLVDDDSVWNEMTEPETTPVDQYFTRYTYTTESLPEHTNKCRFKIELKSEEALETPVLRKLITIMKNV